MKTACRNPKFSLKTLTSSRYEPSGSLIPVHIFHLGMVMHFMYNVLRDMRGYASQGHHFYLEGLFD